MYVSSCTTVEKVFTGNAAKGSTLPGVNGKSRPEQPLNDFHKIICPFFNDAVGTTIRCEGFRPKTLVSQTFGGIRDLKKYRNNYCDTFSYGKCELCKVIMKKYE